MSELTFQEIYEAMLKLRREKVATAMKNKMRSLTLDVVQKRKLDIPTGRTYE